MTKLRDDLKTEVVTETNIDSLLNESFEIRVRDIDQAIQMAKDALQLSESLHYTKGIAYAYCYLGYFNMICSNHKESLEYSNKANELFEILGDQAGLASVAYSIGSVHYKTDDTHLGLKYLLDSLELYQLCNDILGQARALKAIGTMYEYLGQYKNAEETYLKTIELSESIGDLNGKSNALNPLSGILLKKNEIDKALATIEESIYLKNKTQDTRGLAFALYGKAKVLTAMSQFDEARKFYIQSMETHRSMNDMLGVMMSLNKLGDLHYKMGEFDAAKKYLNECVREGKKTNHYLIMHKAYNTLYKISKKEGDTTKALSYLELHINNKEKVLNTEVTNVIRSIQNMSKVEILEKEAKWQKEINESVELKNAELDKFVYKVSHDLRGPISSLMGLYNLVDFEVKDETALKYFNIYNDQVQILNNRLMGFIDLIQVKDKKIELKEIKFQKIVDECISSFNYFPNFDKIDFQLQIDDDIEFKSDESAVITIVHNLIENSVKYAREDVKPMVKIDISTQSPYVCIEVEDNGEGIKKEHREKVFDMFHRANDKTKGTGLGLYLLKHAVEKLSGEFSFESKEGQGTKFVIRLTSLGSQN